MKGKERCALLKQIRKEIAESNGIVYLTSDCPYEDDDCKGSCPISEAEIRYIDSELNRKVEAGGNFSLAGLALETYGSIVEKENSQPSSGKKEEPPLDTLLDLSIEERDMSIRTTRILNAIGICNVRTLISYTKEEYLQFAGGFPRKCAEEVEYNLRLIGLSLRERINVPTAYCPEKQMPLYKLHLFPRTFMWLKLEKGIHDVQTLLTKTMEELELPDRRCKDDVITRLRSIGLSLRKEEPVRDAPPLSDEEIVDLSGLVGLCENLVVEDPPLSPEEIEELEARLSFAWKELTIEELEEQAEICAKLYKGNDRYDLRGILDMPIEQMDFGPVVLHLLHDAGIEDVKTLLSYTKLEYSYRNITGHKMEKIEHKLAMMGLGLQEGTSPTRPLPSDITLENLHFFPQTNKALWRIGVKNVQTLREKSEDELFIEHDLNPRSIMEIRMRLNACGLALSQKPYVLTRAKEKKMAHGVPIQQFNFSVRTFNCLKRANINTLEDIIAHTQSDLIMVRNLGRNSLEEIEEVLDALGLHLAEEEE